MVYLYDYSWLYAVHYIMYYPLYEYTLFCHLIFLSFVALFSIGFSQIRFFHSILGIIFSIFIASYNSFINLYFYINIGKRSIDCYPEITSHSADNYI